MKALRVIASVVAAVAIVAGYIYLMSKAAPESGHNAASLKNVVYIEGAVVRPGAFGLPASGLTVKQALALAGGPSADAVGFVNIMRMNPDGSTMIFLAPTRLPPPPPSPNTLGGAELIFNGNYVDRASLAACESTPLQIGDRITFLCVDDLEINALNTEANNSLLTPEARATFKARADELRTQLQMRNTAIEAITASNAQTVK